MVSNFVLSNLLLASAALAAPSSQQGARLARRQENHQSQPVDSIALSARATLLNLNPDWAGAAVSRGNRSFTTVTGSFTVPTLSSGAGGSNNGFSIFVALDGYTCQKELLAGIEANSVDGVWLPYNAWYALQPGYTRDPGYASFDISGFTINATDVVVVTINAVFTDSGSDDVYTVNVENQTTEQLVSQELRVPTDSEFALCGWDAQWGVGKFRGTEGSPPLADFGTVTITNAIATGVNISGSYNPLSNATIRDIVQVVDGDEIIYTYVTPGRGSLLVQYLSGN